MPRPPGSSNTYKVRLTSDTTPVSRLRIDRRWRAVYISTPMKGILLAHALLFAVATLPLSGQQPPKPQLPKGQMPELGRPTQGDDPLPTFNFDDYFLGKWTFEWDVPEGPLGAAGRITGTTVYTAVDGRFYEAKTDATGAWGPFSMRELIAYHKENKTFA